MYGINTLAQAEAALRDAQFVLVNKATESTHRLADYVNEVEEWQGVVAVFAEWERSLTHIAEFDGDASPERIELEKWKVLTRMALKDTDDTWSGRCNDARRAYADGRRKALNKLETNLSYDD